MDEEVIVFDEDYVFSRMNEEYMRISEEIDKYDVGSKERKELVKERDILSNQITAYQSNIYERHDKEKRREMEDSRNKAMVEIERDKQKITWKKWLFENSKTIIPTTITIGTYVFVTLLIAGLEVTGVISTNSMRKIEIPKIFKK